MQLVLHAGAHNTDEDRLLKCLTANREVLAARGTQVPNARSYRKLLRDVLHAAAGGAIAGDAREVLMDALAFDTAPERLFLSNPGFFGTPRMAASGGDFYTSAERRIGIFREIFAQDEIELFFGICNPATFLPAILPQTKFDSLADYLRGTDPTEMRWSDMIERLRGAHPDIRITVWCNEDTPLIWDRLVRDMGGVDRSVPLAGTHELLREILTPAGMTRLNAYMAKYPGLTEAQERRVIAAFLDKYAEEGAMEAEVDLPGWTEDVVDRLSDLYDADVDRIGSLPGITLIMP